MNMIGRPIKVFMSVPQQPELVVLVMPAIPAVDAIGVVEEPRLITQGLDEPGDATNGLTPALPSSVEPRGIEPTGATPVATPAVVPLKAEAGFVVPDAVPPAPHSDDVDVPIASVLTPASSKVEDEPAIPEPVAELPAPDMPVPDTPDAAAPDIPAARHGFVLVIEPNGDGLRPPGESSVAPSGIPTGPAADVAPGMPSGVAAPIAGTVGVSGAWANAVPALSTMKRIPVATCFNIASFTLPCAFAS
jgi:hypothetical protein